MLKPMPNEYVLKPMISQNRLNINLVISLTMENCRQEVGRHPCGALPQDFELQPLAF